jgi:hypothetical protein
VLSRWPGEVTAGSVAASFSSCRQHVPPDLKRECGNLRRIPYCVFLQLLDQFDSGKHDTGGRGELEAQHGVNAELHALMVLLDDVVEVFAAADLYGLSHRKVN